MCLWALNVKTQQTLKTGRASISNLVRREFRAPCQWCDKPPRALSKNGYMYGNVITTQIVMAIELSAIE